MFQVLRLLIERRGEMVSKNEFFEKVWEGSFVEDNNLTVTIRALRKVLGEDARHPRFIENLPRKGYRFIAPVISSAVAQKDQKLQIQESAYDPRPKFRRRAKHLIVTAVIVFAIALIIAALTLKRYRASSVLYAHPIESIAILPFETRDTNNEYLADGITDGIIRSLSGISGVRVIDRNSSFQYKNKSVDAAEVSRELNVQSLVTGHFEKVNDAFVITAEVTVLAGNSPPWTQQFRQDNGDIYALQQQIVQAIVNNIVSGSAKHENAQQARPPTRDSEAYDLYLRGRYFWNKRTNKDIIKSLELFREAIDKDPAYAQAYVGLANAYALADLSQVGISSDERVKLSQGAIKRALEIDDTLGEAYAATGLNKTYHDWDLAGAEALYRRALELNPNDATTHHWYAELLSMDGRFDESYRQYDLALSLDPLSMPIRTDMGFAHYYAHDNDIAIEILDKAKEINPDYLLTYTFLMFAYREKGMFDESVNCIEKVATIQFQSGERPKDSFDAMITYASELRKAAGESGATGYWRTELKSDRPDAIYKAVAYSKLGETDKAFEYLEKAFNEHLAGMVWLKVQPEFNGIRSDPRYQDLLHRVGFRLDAHSLIH
jgi:TolB-like protein/DNA-binding winged helix-turn-helix (wHTH) protein